MNDLERYLEELEKKAEKCDLEKMYLWPRTPDIPTHQSKIFERVGAFDYESANPVSRSYKTIKELKSLLSHKRINDDFSIVDITCGDGINLCEIKKTYKKSNAYGVDCFKDRFVTHPMCYDLGIKIFAGYIQQMFNQLSSQKFDVAIMFNSYRAWESADLHDDEKNLPELADAYWANNVRYTFLTATSRQILKLKSDGMNVKILGKGEDDSLMFVLSKEEIPCSFREKIKQFYYLYKIKC